MISEERLPSLGRRTSSLGHVFCHARLSDRDVELEQLSMDPWRSPQWVGDAHLADQSAYFQRNCWPATTRSRFQRQYKRKPARCHLITVPGLTIASASRMRGK